jgi:branched-chain amino acid transport system permease protein
MDFGLHLFVGPEVLVTGGSYHDVGGESQNLFFLGIFEALGPGLILEGLGIPASYQLKDVIAFTLLVLVLIFRPSGILGERLSEEKV